MTNSNARSSFSCTRSYSSCLSEPRLAKLDRMEQFNHSLIQYYPDSVQHALTIVSMVIRADNSVPLRFQEKRIRSAIEFLNSARLLHWSFSSKWVKSEYEDLAHRTSLSQEHLGRLCRLRLGLTIQGIHFALLFDEACKRLAHPDIKPVKTIARELKFTNTHFSHWFRRQSGGLSPTQFRRRIGLLLDWKARGVAA